MWKYVKRSFFFAVLAGLFMIGEVMMDLIQPQIMGQILEGWSFSEDFAGLSIIFLFIFLGRILGMICERIAFAGL